MSRTRDLLEKKKKAREASAALSVGASTPQQPTRSRTQELLAKKQGLDLAPKVQTSTSTPTSTVDREKEMARLQEQRRQAQVDMDMDAVNAADLAMKMLRAEMGQQTLGDRLGDMVGASAAGTVGGVASAVNTVEQLLGKEDVDHRLADIAAQERQRFTESAKEGLGGVGQFAVDAGIAGMDMLGDAVAGAFLPGGGLTAMAIRGFGGSAQEARQSGATLGEQVAYGLGSAGVSVLTEKLGSISGVFRSVYGPGILDKALTKLTSKPMGKLVASAISEGGEEFIEALAQPVLQKLTYNPEAAYDSEWLSEALYSAAIGSALGGIGGVGDVALDRAAARQQNAENPQETAKPGEVFQTQEQEAEKRPQNPAPAPSQDTTEGDYTSEDKNAAEAREMALEMLLGNGERVDQAKLSNEQFDALADRGDVGVDAMNRVYQMDPSQHISQRTSEGVSDRKVNAFQFDHPELQPYYKQAAQQLINDAHLSLDAPSTTRVVRTSQGKKRISEIMDTPSLRYAMDLGLTRNDIIKAAEDLMADHGQENHAAAKRLEFVLDHMLSNGYTTARGEQVAANEQYVQAKQGIAGYTEEVREELPIWDMDEQSNMTTTNPDMTTPQSLRDSPPDNGGRIVASGDVHVNVDADVKSMLENQPEQAYNGTNNKEGVNNGTEGVHLRQGGQRADSADPGRSVRQLEEGAGRNQSGNVQARPADAEAAGLSYGRKVSTAELGIEGGKTNDGVFLIDSKATTATRAAQRIADERGLKLVLFAGHDLHTDAAPDGARGYTDGKTLYVRADDPDFTAEQIALHEAGHVAIARGEIDLDKVHERIVEVVGSENAETAAGFYAQAYEGTGMTLDEIWEEIVCDVLGGMNIFREWYAEAESFLDDFLVESWESVENSRQTPRGPPAKTVGEMSRRTGGAVKAFRRNFSGKVDTSAEVWVSDEEKAKIGHALKSGWGEVAPDGKGGRVNTSIFCYVFEVKGRDVEIVGLDLKEDVIEFCNKTARELGYDELKFLTGDIADYESDGADMVVTLHACDTATDYALINAVRWHSKVILSVPCCQHEMFSQIKNEVNEPMFKHGIIKDKFTELLTDGLRGLKLESVGYDVNMIEFTSLEHTSKNIMIKAVLPEKTSEAAMKKALAEYDALKACYNVKPTIDLLK